MKILVRGCPAGGRAAPVRYAVAGASCRLPPVRVSPRLISQRRLTAAARMWSHVFVVDGAAVADSAVAVLDEPGDGAFDRWSPAAVVGLPVRVGCSLAAGGRLQVVVWGGWSGCGRLWPWCTARGGGSGAQVPEGRLALVVLSAGVRQGSRVPGGARPDRRRPPPGAPARAQPRPLPPPRRPAHPAGLLVASSESRIATIPTTLVTTTH